MSSSSELFSHHLHLATQAEDSINNSEALQQYQKCFELDPSNNETKQKYLSFFKKNLEDTSSNKSQDELKLVGNEYVSNSKYEEAIIAYTASIDLDPSVEAAAAIYSNRSLCYFNLQKFQEAYDDGSMASILRPEWPRGWMRRAVASAKLELWEDSQIAFIKYSQLDPEGSKQQEVAALRNVVKQREKESKSNKKHKGEFLERIRTFMNMFPENRGRADVALLYLRDAIASRGCSGTDSIYEHSVDVEMGRVALECFPRVCTCAIEFETSSGGTMDLLPLSLVIQRRQHEKEESERRKCVEMALILIEFAKKIDLLKLSPDALHFACGAPVSPKYSAAKSRQNSSSRSTHQSIVPPSPEIILALLRAGADPNSNFFMNSSPLQTLAGHPITRLPGELDPQYVASLDALLSWKGVEINPKMSNAPVAISKRPIRPLLMSCCHPEVAKVLIRHGADPQAVLLVLESDHKLTTKASVLGSAALHHSNPWQAELLRVLITAGAKFPADGDDGKSSYILQTAFSQKTDNGEYMSEETAQLIIHQCRSQGLELGFRSAKLKMNSTFLAGAIRCGAPLRIIELLCGMDPTAVNRAGEADVLPIEATAQAVASGQLKYVPDALNVFRVLLEHGADLLKKSSLSKELFDMDVTVFFCVPILLKTAGCSHERFDKLVLKIRGEKYFLRCQMENNLEELIAEKKEARKKAL